MITFTSDFHSNCFAEFLLYLIQFFMNFREILENNKINIFTTIFQKIVILKKIGLVDFFGDFLSHFIYLCLRFKQNISFENFVQNIDNPFFLLALSMFL